MNKNLVSSGFFRTRRGRLRRPSVAFKSARCKCKRDSLTCLPIKDGSIDAHLLARIRSASDLVGSGFLAAQSSFQEFPADRIEWYHWANSDQLIRGLRDDIIRDFGVFFSLEYAGFWPSVSAHSFIHQEEFSVKSPKRRVLASGSKTGASCAGWGIVVGSIFVFGGLPLLAARADRGGGYVVKDSLRQSQPLKAVAMVFSSRLKMCVRLSQL